MTMTWEGLFLLSLSKKRPKKWFPDTRGVGYWWLSQCTFAQKAFWKCVFLGHPVGNKVFLDTWISGGKQYVCQGRLQYLQKLNFQKVLVLRNLIFWEIVCLQNVRRKIKAKCWSEEKNKQNKKCRIRWRRGVGLGGWLWWINVVCQYV